MATFGQQMKALRASRKLTVVQVADRLGTHKGYVSAIENGKVNPPSVKFIKRFARLYKVDYREILLQAEIEKVHPDVRDYVRMVVEQSRTASAPKPIEPAAV